MYTKSAALLMKGFFNASTIDYNYKSKSKPPKELKSRPICIWHLCIMTSQTRFYSAQSTKLFVLVLIGQRVCLACFSVGRSNNTY